MWASAQKAKVKPAIFEDIRQVTMQSTANASEKFSPPRTNDFKIYDGVGNFRHLFM
jgi:hypothetical protein